MIPSSAPYQRPPGPPRCLEPDLPRPPAQPLHPLHREAGRPAHAAHRQAHVQRLPRPHVHGAGPRPARPPGGAPRRLHRQAAQGALPDLPAVSARSRACRPDLTVHLSCFLIRSKCSSDGPESMSHMHFDTSESQRREVKNKGSERVGRGGQREGKTLHTQVSSFLYSCFFCVCMFLCLHLCIFVCVCVCVCVFGVSGQRGLRAHGPSTAWPGLAWPGSPSEASRRTCGSRGCPVGRTPEPSPAGPVPSLGNLLRDLTGSRSVPS
jgi:hypothetical protein